MAIAFDKSDSSSNAGTTTTVSMAAAAANEMAIILLSASTAGTFSAVTVNGVAATQRGSTYDWNSERTFAVYYYSNPSTSAVTYSATTSVNDGIRMLVQLYSGADAPNADATGSNLAADSLTLTVDVVTDDSWLASIYGDAGAGSSDIIAGTGTVEREDLGADASGDSNTTVASGSRSMGWSGSRLRAGGFIVAIPPTAPTT